MATVTTAAYGEISQGLHTHKATCTHSEATVVAEAQREVQECLGTPAVRVQFPFSQTRASKQYLL